MVHFSMIEFSTNRLILVTVPTMDDLKKAAFSCGIPYMAEDLSHEEMRKYIISFVDDKRIPSNVLFNLFQTTLKLFNTAGGTADSSIWDSPRNNVIEARKVVFNDVDMVCISYEFSLFFLPILQGFNPSSIDAIASRTYPTVSDEDTVMTEDDMWDALD
jgi:hypothetical protein